MNGPALKRVAFVLILALGSPSQPGALDSDTLYHRAQKTVESGHLSEALPLFETALKASPNDLRIGNDYRQVVVRIDKVPVYNRCIAFFDSLTTAHPDAPNAWLNLGYAKVDKIPQEGAITQVLLANTALGYFTTALELEETWLGLYTRGNSYLYWPAIFGRTPLAVRDLERAIALSRETKAAGYHARAYVGLGEAHWRLDDLDAARAMWQEGLTRFPENVHLQGRLSRDDASLNKFLSEHFEPGQRVDTDLTIIWEGQ
jgi:tetratricopeptide (TPR) repeat protein